MRKATMGHLRDLSFGICLLVLLCTRVAHGCTLVALGKKATFDGSAMIAHTTDAGGGAYDFRLTRVPAMDWPAHSKRPCYEFLPGRPRITSEDRGPMYKPQDGEKLQKPLGYIPQVNHTYAYFDEDYGLINEHQLVIGETTCGARTVGWPTSRTWGKAILGIDEMSRIAMERCITARCAIQTMGDLAVEYGFYSMDSGDPANPAYADSAETLGIADKHGEAWIFHVLTGVNGESAIWAAQRVPDDGVAVSANSFTIRHMDLDDKDNFMASPRIKEIAKEQGWWNPKEEFDFYKVYGNVIPDNEPLYPLYSGRRMWRIYDILAPKLKLDPMRGQMPQRVSYPFSITPEKKVHVRDMFAILRDFYEGTQFDMSKSGIAGGPWGTPERFAGKPTDHTGGGWERTISMHRTMYSFVGQSRGWLPDEIGGRIFYGESVPHSTVYIPFYGCQEDYPAIFHQGYQSKFSRDSAYWAFAFVDNWSNLRFDKIHKDVTVKQHELEEKAFNLTHQWEEEAQNMCSSSGSSCGDSSKKVIDFLSKKASSHAEDVVESWWKFGDSLISKYAGGYITTCEGGPECQKAGGYPNWFFREAGYDSWPGENYDYPHHKVEDISPPPLLEMEDESAEPHSEDGASGDVEEKKSVYMSAESQYLSAEHSSPLGFGSGLILGGVVAVVAMAVYQRAHYRRRSGYVNLG